MSDIVLYIDKWFIAGAVSYNGALRPLKPKNGDERISLYFHTDTVNNRVDFGYGFRDDFLSNRPGYYGDVFTRMKQSKARYEQYGSERPLKDIFADAGIFYILHESAGINSKIKTYASFSDDITPYARRLFLDEMAKAGFEVEADAVVTIERLALEHLSHTGIDMPDGYYLLLNACNENLHYCLYEHNADSFVRKAQDTLPGFGVDARRRAIVEYVVDNINRTHHLLATEAEKDRELVCQAQYAERWLNAVDSVPTGLPVTLSGIKLSAEEHTSFSVTVLPSDIEHRTKAIIENVAVEIVKFVASQKVSQNQMSGIIFIGDTFYNSAFRDEVCSKYAISFNRHFSDRDLPQLVAAHCFVDSEQYRERVKSYADRAEEEKNKIISQEEKESREEEEIDRLKREGKSIEEINRKNRSYKEAISSAEDAGSRGDYTDMAAYARLALGIKPEDTEAQRLLDEAKQMEVREQLSQEQYNNAMDAALQALNAFDWDTAIRQAEFALNIKPKSREASEIKEKAREQVDAKAYVEQCLIRADAYIEQRLYDKALSELKKAELRGAISNEIEQRREQIEQLRTVLDKDKTRLEQALNEGAYDEAIVLCDKLNEQDPSGGWKRRREQIESEKQQAEKVSKLAVEINKARVNADSSQVVKLCRQLLAIKENEKFRRWLEEAEKALKVEEQTAQTERLLDELENLAGNDSLTESDLKRLDGIQLNAKQRNRLLGLKSNLFEQKERERREEIAKMSSRLDDVERMIERGELEYANEELRKLRRISDNDRVKELTAKLTDAEFGRTVKSKEKQPELSDEHKPRKKVTINKKGETVVISGSSAITGGDRPKVIHDIDKEFQKKQKVRTEKPDLTGFDDFPKVPKRPAKKRERGEKPEGFDF